MAEAAAQLPVELMPAPEQEPMRLRNPAEIAQILTRINDSHSLLSVNLKGTPGTYTSLLLGIDHAANRLLFDELYPPFGARMVRRGTPLIVSMRLDGTRIEFTCPVEGVITIGGAPAYRTLLPTAIDYYERRVAYRLVIPSSLHIPPMLFDSPSGPMRARLMDISRHGAGALLPTEAEADIGALVICTVNLPDRDIRTDAQIRSTQESQGQVRLGVQFSLTPAQRNALDASIATLERNLLRHYAGQRQH